MAIKLSDVSNVLQKVIMPYIQDNFPKQTILLDKVKRNAGVTFMNNYFYAATRVTRHGGVVALADDDNKLVSSKTAHSQLRVPVKILTGTFDISKLTIDATKTVKGAVENQLTHQAKTLASDYARSVNRQFYGDGSGILSQVLASVSSTTFTLEVPDGDIDDGRAINRFGTINGDVAYDKYLTAGQQIGIGTAAAGTEVISSIAGGTVTVSGTVASVADDAIGLVDGGNEGFGTSEIDGLGKAFRPATSGSYANVARTTFGMTAQYGTTSEALTLSRMEDKYLSAKEYAQMGDQYAIFVNKTLYKKYGDILTSMRRTVKEADLLGGWTGLEFAVGAGRVGVFLDYDVPDGTCLIVNLDSLTITQVSDLDWMEDPSGGALLRKVDYLTYQATMAWFVNFFCLAPAANGALYQKTD